MGCPARGASCLSAVYVWQQLVPDFAALARSLCVALEAWPREVPKPALFTDSGKVKSHEPLGLQYNVRASVSVCSVPRIPPQQMPACPEQVRGASATCSMRR